MVAAYENSGSARWRMARSEPKYEGARRHVRVSAGCRVICPCPSYCWQGNRTVGVRQLQLRGTKADATTRHGHRGRWQRLKYLRKIR
eukprot:scaffold200558_cov31-Tisochrysis_lutea.AAC.3